MDPSELPSRLDLPRPAPPRAPLRELGERLRWFGLGRLVAAAVSTVLVAGGAWWLVAAPAPAPEVALPVASTVPSATLPPPSTAEAPPSSAAPGTPPPTVLVVHVAGAVVAPGVQRLPGGARVADAVAAAGGVAPDGDLDALNLAALLVDGERVYVPVVGEVDPASVPTGAASPVAGSPVPPDAGPVDVNVATAAELEALPGVGPALAAAIVDDRDRNGPFASVDDLDRVSGIGPAKLETLRGLVAV